MEDFLLSPGNTLYPDSDVLLYFFLSLLSFFLKFLPFSTFPICHEYNKLKKGANRHACKQQCVFTVVYSSAEKNAHTRIWFHRRMEHVGLGAGAWSTRRCFQTLTPRHDDVWTQENFQWNQHHHPRVYFQGEVGGRGTFSAYRPALARIGAAIRRPFPWTQHPV